MIHHSAFLAIQTSGAEQSLMRTQSTHTENSAIQLMLEVVEKGTFPQKLTLRMY
jgi:hypothetical protein